MVSWINRTSWIYVIKECYMRFDDLIKILLGGICRLCRVVSPWSDRHPSYLYFLHTRVGELKVHLLLLHSSVLNRVELGYLVMLLNQMKCSNYKIYWNVYLVFLNIEVAGHVCRLHLWVAYVLPECWFISVPANFGCSICPILAKVMPDFSGNLSMTCARLCRKYRVPQIS